MKKLVSVTLSILMIISMLMSMPFAGAASKSLTEQMVEWTEETEFFYNGDWHSRFVQAVDEEATLQEDVDYRLTYYIYNGEEFAAIEGAPCEIGEYSVTVSGIGEYQGEASNEFSIVPDTSQWGNAVFNNDAENFVDETGLTSTKVDNKDITWLKEESSGTSAWYGVDNRGSGEFRNGSRFWTKWLSENDDEQAFENCYNQLDDACKNAIEDGKLWLFRTGVTDPDGNEYTDFSNEVSYFVQLDSDWDVDDIHAIWVSNGNDEEIDLNIVKNMNFPEGTGNFAKLTLNHFSTYAIYEQKEEATPTPSTEPYVDFAATAPIATVRIDTAKINRANAAISYRDNSKRFDINEQGYVYAENCTVKQGGYTGLGGFTLSFADAAVLPDGSRKPLEVFFSEVHTIGRTDVAQYTDKLYFAQITDNPSEPLDFTPLSEAQKHVAIRSRVYFSVPQAGTQDTFLFTASGINASRGANSSFAKIVDAAGHYNYSESMEPMSGIAEGTGLYYPADTELNVVQGTTAGSLGVRFVGAGNPLGNILEYKNGFAAVGNAKTGFSSRIWSSCGTSQTPLQINLLTPGAGYELTTAAGENGSISLWTDGTANSQTAAQLAGGTTAAPLSYSVPKGKAVTLVITPDTGYELNTLSVNGTAVEPTRSNGFCGPYEYDIPADMAKQLNDGNCAVSATFKTFEKRTKEMLVITQNWTYGEDSSMCLRVSPASIPAYATVTKLYKVRGADDSTYTTEKPTQAGEYTVKFIRSETDYYKEDVQIVNFTIYQADPTYTVPTGLTATYGDTLSSVALPEGWQWDDDTMLVGNAGDNRFAATFTPADVKNYKTASETVSLSVAPKAITVTADDKSSFRGADLAALTYTVSEGLVAGDELGITLNTAADKNTCGTYDITVAHGNHPNYTITAVNGSYRVMEVPVYDFTLGDDAQWTQDSDETLDFTLARSYDDETTFDNLRGIEVDGIALESIHYDATRGSVNISLKASFLNTLAVGEHTLKVLFNDGDAETIFTVLKANEEPAVEPQEEDLPEDEDLPADTVEPTAGKESAQPGRSADQHHYTSPKTGDTVKAWTLIFLVSTGTGTAAVMMLRKKKKRAKAQELK